MCVEFQHVGNIVCELGQSGSNFVVQVHNGVIGSSWLVVMSVEFVFIMLGGFVFDRVGWIWLGLFPVLLGLFRF